jgi:hypothetical protein
MFESSAAAAGRITCAPRTISHYRIRVVRDIRELIVGRGNLLIPAPMFDCHQHRSITSVIIGFCPSESLEGALMPLESLASEVEWQVTCARVSSGGGSLFIRLPWQDME